VDDNSVELLGLLQRSIDHFGADRLYCSITSAFAHGMLQHLSPIDRDSEVHDRKQHDEDDWEHKNKLENCLSTVASVVSCRVELRLAYRSW